MIYQFDDCELDPGRILLRRGGDVVAVEPQVFDLLHCLIEHRGQLVTKEELLDTVWGDRFVGESALTSRVKSARRAVGDDGTAQRIIRTVHGKGYEFVAPVNELDDADAGTVDAVVDRQRRPGPSASSAHRSPIPLAVHTLVGRDDMLAELVGELREARLLTIVGPGGVGRQKIRVAPIAVNATALAAAVISAFKLDPVAQFGRDGA